MSRLLPTWSIVLCVVIATPHANAAFFVPLGHLRSEDQSSYAADVSADGSVVVGHSAPTAFSGLGGQAFRWTRDGGMIGLGNLPEDDGSYALGVSADGSVVVGSSYSGFINDWTAEAFHWTSDGGMVGLGVQPGNSSSDATAASADGLVVVGSSYTPWFGGDRPAFRWTSAQGMVELGDLPGGDINSRASDLSADGSVIVGWSSASTGDSLYTEAFRWTDDAGMVGLGDLPGGEIGSDATAVSSDGSVIVGSSVSSADGAEAFRWTSGGGLVGLGDLPGGSRRSAANDASADGLIVVGGSDSERGTEAFVWDAINGMRSLSDVLTDMDIDVSGWMLTQATAISADGTTIVGHGVNPSGQTEAWLANISAVPEPSAASIVLAGVMTLAAGGRTLCRRRL